MTHRHTFAQVNFVKIAIGFAAALATMFTLMAVTAAPSQANTKSKNCNGALNCNTIIDVGGVEVNIHADRVLSDIEAGNVENNTIKVLNDNNCNVITVLCQDKVQVYLLNNVLVWAKAPITVLGITVVKL
jgi:hypothetical protein